MSSMINVFPCEVKVCCGWNILGTVLIINHCTGLPVCGAWLNFRGQRMTRCSLLINIFNKLILVNPGSFMIIANVSSKRIFNLNCVADITFVSYCGEWNENYVMQQSSLRTNDNSKRMALRAPPINMEDLKLQKAKIQTGNNWYYNLHISPTCPKSFCPSEMQNSSWYNLSHSSISPSVQRICPSSCGVWKPFSPKPIWGLLGCWAASGTELTQVKSSKLSPSVWGKLLCESLDPPCVALLAQNVVVQGVAPGGYFLPPGGDFSQL